MVIESLADRRHNLVCVNSAALIREQSSLGSKVVWAGLANVKGEATVKSERAQQLLGPYPLYG